jgi:hypothetical protein
MKPAVYDDRVERQLIIEVAAGDALRESRRNRG